MTTESRAFRSVRAYVALIFLLSPMFAAGSSATAGPSADHAVAVVQDLAADIWTIRDENADPDRRKRLLTRAIEANTNIDLLSRLVLGRHWRSLSAANREEYGGLFSEVVINGLAQRLDSLLRKLDGRLDQHFAIINSFTIGAKDVLVRSKVMPADEQPLSVDWRLRTRDDRPVVIDLIIEGISLLVSQRAEFAAVIEQQPYRRADRGLAAQGRGGRLLTKALRSKMGHH